MCLAKVCWKQYVRGKRAYRRYKSINPDYHFCATTDNRMSERLSFIAGWEEAKGA